MEVTGRRFSIFSLTPSLPPTRRFSTTLLLAKKKDIIQDNNDSQPQPPFLSLRVSNSNLARAAIGVFALGFIDAGGDWSRIGAITPQTEELLRLAAFLVVPICVFFIFSLPKQPN
ncbi:uncharacterized protein LOC123911260 isoform X2 [Trifolium pratense]|uniref:uncharacterized protein LOC123911260 isoform X2 n=1 Tax=Trifolium pratense TaxID=57577 RepID=UPI001E697CF3|nr:uncharacterized protein LOC123911260 isoform X2 [Trifolium pratense]